MKNRKAKTEDFDKLIDIRIRAMKPSLEKVGRFDKNRATERFRNSFIPEKTIIATKKDEILGFYMITMCEEHIFLNHLYVEPKFQNNGIGKMLLEQIKEIAIEHNKSIELEALKQSLANDFYCKNGFKKIGESDFDNLYHWEQV
ncbi:MAG: GNAT family N-acetyltransferase [Spirochaetales bacterium]|nr:GNAT family N-acetyltransferase [Spirochaetales bacterium]